MNFKNLSICAACLGAVALPISAAAEQADVPYVLKNYEPNVVVGDKDGDHNLVNAPLVNKSAPTVNPLANVEEASVHDTMNAVLAYSPSLRTIRENRTAQQYEVKKAYSGYYPSLDISASYGVGLYDNTTSRSSGANANNSKVAASGSAEATLTQILWNGNAVSNSVDYNIFVLESLDSRVYDNATYLALEGLIAHIDVMRSREVLALSEAYVETHRDILSQQEELSLSGIMTEADLTQAQARLIRAIADQQNAVNAYKNSVNNYQQLTGSQLPAHLLEASLPSQAILTAESIIQKAMIANPKIKSYQSDYRASTEQVDLAKADYHPQVTLTFGITYDDPELDINPDNPQYEYNQTATVGMSWNLFNGFATDNSVLAAQARTRMVREETITTIDSVKTDIISTYNDLINARELSGTYDEALGYNLATRDNYLSQFSFGTRSLLDVLDAEAELYTTQVQLATAEANSIINAWKLLALQGTLLDEIGITTQTYQTPVPPKSFGFND